MGKTRVIAETGAGQHGVATATACALFGLECTVYMGEEDIRRQKLNVFNMKTLGATVVPGHDRLADPPRRDQRGDARLDGLVAPDALHDRQRRRAAPVPDDRPRLPGGDRPRDRGSSASSRLGRLPDAVVACVGGGSNAAGMFYPFIDDAEVELIGAEAGGRGPDGRRARVEPDAGQARRPPRQLQLRPPGRRRPDPGRPLDLGRARLSRRRPRAQLLEGPAAGSATRASPTPRRSTPTTPPARHEGILPALESSHALAQALKEAPRLGPGKVLVVCLSGRGDKDAYEVARLRGEPI